MQVIELEGRKRYVPKKGKKVKFQHSDKLYSEIVVSADDIRTIEEVKP